MTLAKIDVSTTPPLRFQYSAKDYPCVFSIEREFPLMFSMFCAIAPLHFQSINKNVSCKNYCLDNTWSYVFSVCHDIPPQHNPSTVPPTTAMPWDPLGLLLGGSLFFRLASCDHIDPLVDLKRLPTRHCQSHHQTTTLIVLICPSYQTPGPHCLIAKVDGPG